jgi:diaminopimelate decarboxylase
MNNDNDLPFTKTDVLEWVKKYPTPFHVFDENGIRTNAKNMKISFGWNKGYRNFFAVKAAPNPYLLKILKEEGMGVD